MSIRTIAASQFVPANLFTVTNMAVGASGNGAGCLDYSGGTCLFTASLDLPSGARIVGLELETCDIALGGSATVELRSCPPGVACSTVTSITSGGVGCIGNTSGVLNTTVSNGDFYYPLIVSITDNSTQVLFRAVRVHYQLQVSPAPATQTFADVATSHQFFRAIEALAASGITSGCGPNSFCPDQTVTRGEIAKFLANALGLHYPN